MPLLIATAYCPPARYMAALVNSGSVAVELHETYPKQTCRNHCAIYGPNGLHTLTIPVIKPNGNRTITRDIRVSDHQPWQRIHWRSVCSAYSNSPFFLYYQDELAPFYEKKVDFLVDFNTGMLEKIFRVLQLDITIAESSTYKKNPAGAPGLRDDLTAKHEDGTWAYPHYTQVFEPRHGFLPGLSILDILYNLGPETVDYLKRVQAGRQVSE